MKMYDPNNIFITEAIPYTSCWLGGEGKSLLAQDFNIGGYQYTFHHWEWRDWSTGNVLGQWYTPGINFTVETSLEDSTHRYLAFFKGGPLNRTIDVPNVTETQILYSRPDTILWSAPEGAYSTCSVYVAYTTNNGSTWTNIVGPVPYNYGSTQADKSGAGRCVWDPPDISSTTCRLRIICWDAATNRDTGLSHQFALGCYKPKADFLANNTSGIKPLAVQFTNISTWQPTTWLWNFGDGTTSTEKNPTHTYTSDGLYSVRLTAIHECGNDDTLRGNLISVNCNVKADFKHNNPTLPLTSMDSVHLFAQDNSTPPFVGIAYLWDWGDGTTSNLMYQDNHKYRTPGKYNVKLTVTFSCGVDDTTKIGFVNVLCCKGIRGNVNHDTLEAINVVDLTYLTNFFFHAGPPPWCLEEANVNGDAGGSVNVVDVTYLVAYLFHSGPPPPSCPATSAEMFVEEAGENTE